jgi:hypothetical protein
VPRPKAAIDMAVTSVRESPVAARLPRLAGWAGVVGPMVFAVGFLAQDLLRADRDPIAEPVSALEAGPWGWAQQANFAVFGVLTLVFAAGLHRGVRPTRAGFVGPALLFVSGVGLLLSAAVPLREDAAGVVYYPGGHLVGGLLFFLASAVGLTVLARRLAGDPRFRGLAPYTLGAGVAAIACVVLTGALVVPDGAPLHEWAGLAQRLVVLAVLLPCRVALAARLLRQESNRRA